MEQLLQQVKSIFGSEPPTEVQRDLVVGLPIEHEGRTIYPVYHEIRSCIGKEVAQRGYFAERDGELSFFPFEDSVRRAVPALLIAILVLSALFWLLGRRQ